jgi:hypothetical protein
VCLLSISLSQRHVNVLEKVLDGLLPCFHLCAHRLSVAHGLVPGRHQEHQPQLPRAELLQRLPATQQHIYVGVRNAYAENKYVLRRHQEHQPQLPRAELLQRLPADEQQQQTSIINSAATAGVLQAFHMKDL